MSVVTSTILVLCSITGLLGQGYSGMSRAQAKKAILANRVSGQIGKSFDFRLTATDRSYNFKLRATWLTPSAIEARARLEQLSKVLSDSDTKRLIEAALRVGEIVIQVEIDPREGSGVIPDDWVALLGPKGGTSGISKVVSGKKMPSLRDKPALAPIEPRDYSYELFWLVFPANREDGAPVFSAQDKEAELLVRIQGKLGRVAWPVPTYLLRKP